MQIVGFKAPSAEAHPDDPPTSQFPPCVLTVNLEAKSTTMDFDVPSTNANK